MTDVGSAAHQALIARVTDHYQADSRVLAVVVFGSVSTGAWHELSDVDLDVVVAEAAASADLGPARRDLLARLSLG